MLYWLIYDITENNIRSKIAKKCKDYGMKRVQKSCFLGSMTRNKLEMLAIEANEVIKDTKNCVFIFPSCKQCYDNKIIEGHFDEDAIKDRDFLVLNGGN